MPLALKDRIDVIEEAYEVMLAYAAQGHTAEPGGPGGIRDHLERVSGALDGLEGAAAALAPPKDSNGEAAWVDFLEIVARDAEKARAVTRFVLAQDTIGSQTVDNLNASLHLRALLTDLFLLDEATGGSDGD